MIKDITLGQYYPGNSVIHKADPRAKLIITILYITAIFLAKSIFSYAAVVLSAVVLLIISGVSVSVVLKGIKPLIYIIIITGIMNILFTTGETPLFEWWIIKIYPEGLRAAGLMVIRIIVLIMGSSLLLTYTTTPIALTDGIEQLLAPLKKIKLPVHDFAMMMTIALRFIPTLLEETDKIMNAQKARGGDFSSGSLIQRAKALVPVLVPLFVSAFRRADELAVAMECRCYRGGDGRTRMTKLKFAARDYILVILTVLFCAMIVTVNIYSDLIILVIGKVL
ncbi:MAG: energy-coupling factor transporter transmembrane protein EcfT [Clostridia bacterium]|nr:energy-coupling factor transporter transmembrane protein EcfT [Clostridia bacterium]